jgi:hypothetical protein
MLLQTNSYVVPADKRADHDRMMRRFRQIMTRLGCDDFDVVEQTGPNWSGGEPTGRFVQIMRFRDRRHQRAVQEAERSDPTAQAMIAEFAEMVNLPYQQQHGLFAMGFYHSALPAHTQRELSPAEGGIAQATESAEAGESVEAAPSAEASSETSGDAPMAEADVIFDADKTEPDDASGGSSAPS